jgi:hypothetical protein
MNVRVIFNEEVQVEPGDVMEVYYDEMMDETVVKINDVRIRVKNDGEEYFSPFSDE